MSDSAGMGPGGGVHDQCVDGDQLRSAKEYLPESDGQGQGSWRRLGQHRRRHHHTATQAHIRYEKRRGNETVHSITTILRGRRVRLFYKGGGGFSERLPQSSLITSEKISPPPPNKEVHI